MELGLNLQGTTHGNDLRTFARDLRWSAMYAPCVGLRRAARPGEGTQVNPPTSTCDPKRTLANVRYVEPRKLLREHKHQFTGTQRAE